MTKKRVLLVDDNNEVLRTIWQLLDSEFRVVAAVSDSTVAGKMALESGADVIVLDISMPEVDGFELVRSLRAEGCHCGIVFLTVHSEGPILVAALATGVQGYVVKSNAGNELSSAIHAASRGETFISPAIGHSSRRNE